MKLIYRIQKNNILKIKFLGYTLYKKIQLENEDEQIWLHILKKQTKYTYKNYYKLKKYYLINILLFSKKEADINLIINRSRKTILEGVRRLNTIAFLHQKTFSEFKNIHQGKSAVLIGAGPSLNYFEPLKGDDIIYTGCNRAFLNEKIKFNYIFAIDKLGLQQYYENLLHYKGNNCIFFLGDQNLGKNFQIPESYINRIKNVKQYKTTTNLFTNRFTFDINSEPLGNFNSVAMQAIQFLFYTNPSKIYLVGIDCNTATAGYFIGNANDISFRGESQTFNDNKAVEYWKNCKKFRDTYYPDTEIISINPVRLKGIFTDVYTESYLNEHPEIREKSGNNIKILNSFEDNDD